ncbi:MAG: hypothetical protein ACI4C5_08640 [Lachnospiraceae bacterium]
MKKMLKAKNLTAEGHVIFKDNYIILPYGLNLSKIFADPNLDDDDGADVWIEKITNELNFLDKEILEEFMQKDIFKIPKYEIIMDSVFEFSEKTRMQVTDVHVLHSIENTVTKFIEEFGPLYSSHTKRLTSRLICLNRLNDLYAPDFIRLGEEALCAKEAVIMLSLIKVCAPDINIEDCLKEEENKE